MEQRRSTFERECEGKHAHRSLAKAQRHAARHGGINAYRCSFCGLWHVGHPRSPELDGPPKLTAQSERRAWRRSRRRWIEKYAGKRRAGEAQ